MKTLEQMFGPQTLPTASIRLRDTDAAFEQLGTRFCKACDVELDDDERGLCRPCYDDALADAEEDHALWLRLEPVDP